MGSVLSVSPASLGCCVCAERPTPPTADDVPTRADDPPSPTSETPNFLLKTQPSLIETQECNASIIAQLQSELIQQSAAAADTEESEWMEDDRERGENPGLNLTLKVINSNVLRRGAVINITEVGCAESQRKEWDRVTYFGFDIRGEKAKEDACDVVIPSANPDIAERHNGRHFQIRNNPLSHRYYMKDLGKGFGVFMRLDGWLPLLPQMLLSIGESFLVVSLLTTPGWTGPKRLRVKSFSSTCTGEVLYFHPTNPPYLVRVGRHNICEVKIDDGLLSKIHLTIICSQDGKWALYDGDPESARVSTNGSWVYLNQEREVENGMTFKVCGTVFESELWRKA